jgi:uncharacterized DUF497 family protein
MLNWSVIVGFDWDDGNSQKSLDKHAVTAREAEEVFTDPYLLVLVDELHSGDEQRFHAYGVTLADRQLQVGFTLRQAGSRIRVISARSMSRKERARYEQEI